MQTRLEVSCIRNYCPLGAKPFQGDTGARTDLKETKYFAMQREIYSRPSIWPPQALAF